VFTLVGRAGSVMGVSGQDAAIECAGIDLGVAPDRRLQV
jgi:hypothetical protein